jgi:hypothetical protein
MQILVALIILLLTLTHPITRIKYGQMTSAFNPRIHGPLFMNLAMYGNPFTGLRRFSGGSPASSDIRGITGLITPTISQSRIISSTIISSRKLLLLQITGHSAMASPHNIIILPIRKYPTTLGLFLKCKIRRSPSSRPLILTLTGAPGNREWRGQRSRGRSKDPCAGVSRALGGRASHQARGSLVSFLRRRRGPSHGMWGGNEGEVTLGRETKQNQCLAR